MRGRVHSAGAVMAIVVLALTGCEREITIEDETPDVITIVEEIWHTTTEHVWHTTTIVEEDTTPDVVENWHFEYPSGPVPCLVLMEGGVPAMADQPLSGLAAATTMNDPDLMLITQSATSKKLTYREFPLPTNYIGGLICSNNGTDPDADVDVAVGSCRDNTDAINMRLSSSITKQLDAAWAVGTNQGGLDTGSIASDTLYAVWLIMRSDTGVVDVLFSTSFTAPTMPTNYDYKRLIGAVKTDASSDIHPFLQSGDHFTYLGANGLTPPKDINDSTITSTTIETGVLSSVPPSCMAHYNASLNNPTSSGATDGRLYIRAYIGDSYIAGWPHFEQRTASNFYRMDIEGWVQVDSSQQIEYAAAEVTGSATVDITVIGFEMTTRREP